MIESINLLKKEIKELKKQCLAKQKELDEMIDKHNSELMNLPSQVLNKDCAGIVEKYLNCKYCKKCGICYHTNKCYKCHESVTYTLIGDFELAESNLGGVQFLLNDQFDISALKFHYGKFHYPNKLGVGMLSQYQNINTFNKRVAIDNLIVSKIVSINYRGESCWMSFTLKDESPIF